MARLARSVATDSALRALVELTVESVGALKMNSPAEGRVRYLFQRRREASAL